MLIELFQMECAFIFKDIMIFNVKVRGIFNI